jgi:serralysin
MANGQAPTWNVVTTANTSYQVAGIGDYYGNGTDDILWHNSSTGDTGIWQMNSGQATWHDLGIASTTVNPVKA